jgi:diguanylate cyclase (GGDEF)-like protein
MRWWWVVAACALLAIPTALDPDGPAAGPTYLAGLVLIVAALWWGTLHLRAAVRPPWLLLSAAASCWLVGDTVQRVMELAGHPAGKVGPPDLFWLASYPLLIAAVNRIIKARGLAAGLLRDIRLDVIVVAAAAAVAAWHLLIAPLTSAGGSLSDTIIPMLYPLSDVAVFALAITLAMTAGHRCVAGALLIACLGLTLPVDFLQAVIPDTDSARLDGTLLVLNSLLAAAALHPDRRALTARTARAGRLAMHRWRVVLLGASLCTVSVISAIPDDSSSGLLPSVAASVIVSGVVVVRFYWVVREREAAEAAVTYQAQHDQLTGAANRSLLMADLSRTVRAEAGQDSPVVLIFIDLDGFKTVNDTWGHPAGDKVLRVVARRLAGLVRPTDTVARVGGDEFVVLCRGMTDDNAEALGQRICDAIAQPIDIGTGRASIGASIGVLTTVPSSSGGADDLRVADELLRRVDSAMYQAKRSGGGVRTVGPAAAAC